MWDGNRTIALALAPYTSQFVASFTQVEGIPENDRTITLNELGVSHTLGSIGQKPTTSELQEMSNKADKDRYRTIELSEFVEFIGIKSQVDQFEELRYLPSSTKTGMKKISTSELEKGHRNLCQW